MWRSARVGLVLRDETLEGPQTHMPPGWGPESDGARHGRPVEFCARPYRFSTVAARLTKFRSGFVATAHLAGAASE